MRACVCVCKSHIYINGINGNLDTTENKNNELENRSREIFQIEVQRRKKD